MRQSRLAALLVMAALASTAPAADISVDLTETHQEIDGLGGFGAMQPWWFNGPFHNQEFLDLLIDTLGLTMLRTELYPRPEQENMWTKQIPYLNAMREKAEQSGEPLKFIASVWSPPGYMKSGGSTTGGHLLPEYYDEYGQYLIDYVNHFEDTVGAPLYALSPQNEPGFCFPYNSSCSLPAEYSEELKSVAHTFADNDIAVKLHYADNVWWPDWLGQCVAIVTQDAVADAAAPIFSIHYSDGDEQENWEGNRYCQSMLHGRGMDTHRLWNTEFGGQYDSWTKETGEGGAWKFAKNLHTCLVTDYSAVVYWQLCEPPHDNPDSDHYSLFYYRDGKPEPGPLFYVARAYYRYIRPGAVRVTTTSSDAGIWTVAFKHEQHQTVTVVLLNNTGSQTTAMVSGQGLPSELTAYRTSPGSNGEAVGTVSPGEQLTLPAKSITTLYNTPTTAAIAAPAQGSHERPVTSATNTAALARYYRIDGRLMGGGNGPAAGIALEAKRTGHAVVRSVVPGRR